MKIIEKIPFYLSFIFLIILVVSFNFYYQYGDDFIFLNLLREKNIFEVIVHQYMTWDGRHLSFAGLFQIIGFAYLGPFLSLFLGLIALGIGVWYLLKTIIDDIQYIDFVSIFVLFLIGLLPFYKDVLFWQTGIVYLYIFLQSTIIIFLYRNKNLKSNILIYIFIFFLSLNSQNFNLAVLSYLWCFDLLKGDFNFFEKKRTIYTLLIFLGTLVVSLAPGNFVRIANGTDSIPQWSNAFIMAGVYFKAFNYCKYLFFAGMFGGLFLTGNNKKPFKGEFIPFLTAAVMSLTPFVLYPDLARVRVFFSLGAFLFFAGILIGKLIIYNFSKLRVLASIFIFVGLVVFFNQFFLLKEHCSEIKKREEFLLSNSSSKNLIIPKILKNEALFIIRSPDYEKEWKQEFLEYYHFRVY
ncbi:MAG: hypothetical protein KGZ90_06650 [Algoriphagus sp.]|nr:hypothetical protein [Algoriphagus sp.]